MQKGRRACLPAGKGRVGGLDGRVFGTDALAQGLGSMARTARSLPPYGRGAAAKIQITSPPFMGIAILFQDAALGLFSVA